MLIFLSIHRISDVDFPAISLCPSFDAAYNKKILEKYNWSVGSMRWMKTPETNLSTLEYWHLVTHSLGDIIKSVRIEVSTEMPKTSIAIISMFESINGLSNQFELIDDPRY